MKNAILPSVSSQLHGFGSMSQSIYEVPAQIDGTFFNYMDSNLYNNQYDFAIPPQFPMDYQSGLSTIMTMKRLDCPYDAGAVGYPTCTSTTTTYDDMDNPLQPLPFTNKLSVPLRLDDTDEATKNPRKRPIEATKEGSKIRVSNNKIVLNQTNKKMAHQEQQPSQDKKKQEAFDHISRQKAPVRRSQKLSDKITALQKLVSPYGKTDTASVLEEASISINLLQHQIQNLVNLKLSSSSINTEPLQYQKPHDLRNRGLCLVPVSFTQRLTEPERFTQRPTSRNHAMPRNF